MKAELPIEAYFQVEVCECGGYFDKQTGQHFYLSFPMQADFACNKCGKIARLIEPDFPVIKHRVKEAGK